MKQGVRVEEEDDIFKGLGIEVSLNESEDFLKIKETLTRIGVSSRKEKKLYQSCHILHKRGRYVILHFKELFELDGLESNPVVSLAKMKIIPHREKDEWDLVPKYHIGRKK